MIHPTPSHQTTIIETDLAPSELLQLANQAVEGGDIHSWVEGLTADQAATLKGALGKPPSLLASAYYLITGKKAPLGYRPVLLTSLATHHEYLWHPR